MKDLNRSLIDLDLILNKKEPLKAVLFLVIC
jgi:hypothetical protein